MKADIPGQEVRAVSFRKTPEINGTWKQYSGQKVTGKNKKIPTGILLPFSIDFRSFSAGSGGFPASFRRDPLVSGGRNH
jgi:hypothetical protein